MITSISHSQVQQSRPISNRLRNLLKGSVLALLCSSILLPGTAFAAAEYCHTDEDGDYVCIEKVFGSRSNRGLIYTVNGSVYATRINCYSFSYQKNSIAAVACWNYGA